MSAIYGTVGIPGDFLLTSMGDALEHRGGRDHVLPLPSGACLAYRTNNDGEGWSRQESRAAVADGMVFNADDLGARHPGLARSAAGRTHAAGILLELYRRGGAEALAAVNGDFAVAIWDETARELVLARDSVGSKPLYYTRGPVGEVLFASEYKALLAWDAVAAEPDPDMIQRLQHFKHLPSDRTLLRGVSAVPPGVALVFRGGGEPARRPIYPPVVPQVLDLGIASTRQAVADAFLDAVRRRTAGRGRIGIALSGGIDSIGLACACRSVNPDVPLHAFTAGYGSDDPEVTRAAFVAGHIRAEHHPVIMDPRRMGECLPRLVWHLETPIARTESWQFLEVAAAAAPLADIVLTGAGSDGLFAGMPRHKILWLMQTFPALRTPLGEFYALTQSGRKPVSALGRLLARVCYPAGLPPVPRVAGAGFRPSLPDFPRQSAEFVNEFLAGGCRESFAQWLPKIERALMSAGIETTSPYVDPELVRLAFTIPTRLKIRHGQEKYILRQALRTLVPAEVLNSPKQPMRMRHDSLFADALDALADVYLAESRVRARGFFDPADIGRIRLSRGRSGYSSEAGMRLWTALLTELWAERFLDQRGRAPV